MDTLERIKLNGLTTSYIAKLFGLNRSILHRTLIRDLKTYDVHLTAINQYIDSVEEINNKFRRL